MYYVGFYELKEFASKDEAILYAYGLAHSVEFVPIIIGDADYKELIGIVSDDMAGNLKLYE